MSGVSILRNKGPPIKFSSGFSDPWSSRPLHYDLSREKQSLGAWQLNPVQITEVRGAV